MHFRLYVCSLLELRSRIEILYLNFQLSKTCSLSGCGEDPAATAASAGAPARAGCEAAGEDARPAVGGGAEGEDALPLHV